MCIKLYRLSTLSRLGVLAGSRRLTTHEKRGGWERQVAKGGRDKGGEGAVF